MTTGPFDQQVVFLYTADLERADTFYRHVMGLEQVLDQGICRIFRIATDAFLGVCHDPEKAGDTNGVIVTFVTDDVDRWFGLLEKGGARVVGEPRFNERFNVYHCFIRDPDGNLLEIQQFRDPAWPRAVLDGR